MIDRQNLPNAPGVYVFRNSFAQVIYVGKAKSLRKRVSSYLLPSKKNTPDPKLRSLINSIADVDTYIVKSETEALLLESQLIKKYTPRYNIDLRDDKRFLLIKLDKNSPFPKLSLARLKKNDDALYFGPFPNASAVKQTMLFLTNFFHLRSCSPTIPNENTFKHCLQNIIKNCSAPCINKISQELYHQNIEKLIDVLNGKTANITSSINSQMQKYVQNLQFEKAAEIRDIINNLKSLFVSSQRKFTHARIQKGGGHSAAEELQKLLHLPIFPNRIECFDNSNLFGNQAVASMVCFIDGKPAPSQYRRFKIKTVFGIDDFASMNEIVGRRYSRVIQENLPKPDLIIIDGGQGQLSAAINVLKSIGISPVIFNPYAPVSAVKNDEIIIMGLAKKKEELYIPGLPATVLLPRHSQALHMLQFLRDEAHRFAITFHREYRAKAIASSVLDDIPNIGEKRKKLLLSHFGSVARIRKASTQEIASIKGIGPKQANLIFQSLNKNKEKEIHHD